MVFKPVYILILAFTIFVDYYAGILIESIPSRRKLFLWLSVAVNVGFLSFFKYFNFFNENLTLLLGRFAVHNNIPYLNILLPIGLSFHTFQAMSYTIEVYRGNQKAEKHLGIYAVYVMFYPQLVAGPIERPQHMLHQFYEKVHFDYDRIVSGLKLMLWGLFKKIVIADRLSIYVDSIYTYPAQHSGISSFVGSVFFAFQIYCDFSGYTDIAIGAARVLGIKLVSNFNFPFFSRSVTEYWRRWHISLTTWFSYYLFIPTVTVLRNWGSWATVLGLLLTFFLSGLWHGAAWNFIVFGLIHGVAMIYEFLTKKARKKIFKKMPLWLNETLSLIFTSSYVLLAFIVFRASTMSDALTIIKNILLFKPGGLFIGNAGGFVYSIFGILFLLASDYNEKVLNNKYSLMYSASALSRIVCYVFLIVTILMIGVFNGGQFIYFQF